MLQDKITKTIRAHIAVLEKTFLGRRRRSRGSPKRMVEVFHQGGRLLVIGSGSLGALANHVANLFLHRLSLERPLLPALSLCHDVTLATALAREGRAQQFFARQVRAAAAPEIWCSYSETPIETPAWRRPWPPPTPMGCVSAVLLRGKENLWATRPISSFASRRIRLPGPSKDALFSATCWANW